MKYFFILGRNPSLSIAELDAYLAKNKINFSLVSADENFLIVDTNAQVLDLDELIKQLGGVIKVGVILDKIKNQAELEKLAFDYLIKYSGKIYFGFSVYTENNKINRLAEIALNIKKKLAENNHPVRWVVSREKNLSSVVVEKNKLLTQGAEFVLLNDYVGVTKAVQLFELYGEQDFGRPSRLIEGGLLPPKIGQIMINLAQVKSTDKLLDPFCGSGTILQIAAMMGFKNLYGADTSLRAVESAKENMEWAKQKRHLTDLNCRIDSIDARSLTKTFSLESIDAIVTEPLLGPLKYQNQKYEVRQIINELSALYLEFLTEAKKILKNDGRLIMIWPIFVVDNEVIYLPILNEVKNMGWQIISPVQNQELKNLSFIKINPRGALIYGRPDQKIKREIFIFKK